MWRGKKRKKGMHEQSEAKKGVKGGEKRGREGKRQRRVEKSKLRKDE